MPVNQSGRVRKTRAVARLLIDDQLPLPHLTANGIERIRCVVHPIDLKGHFVKSPFARKRGVGESERHPIPIAEPIVHGDTSGGTSVKFNAIVKAVAREVRIARSRIG